MKGRLPRPVLLAHVLLLLVVVTWGATFPLVKAALRDASPILFNFVRMLLATSALLLVNHRQLRLQSRADLLLGITAGVFLGAGYLFQTVGLAYTSATNSAFITGLVVVLVPLLSAIPLLGFGSTAGLRWTTLLGALLAFTGLALLTSPSGTHFAHQLARPNRGDLLTLLCAFAFAGHLLTLARSRPEASIRSLSTVQVACASMFMLLALSFEHHIFLRPTVRLGTVLLITSLVATAAAFSIQSWAQQHMSSTHTAALLTLEPVFALTTAAIFFHARLNQRSLIGATLIIAGIAVIELLPPTPPSLPDVPF